MAGVVYDDLQSKKSELVRKTLDGSVFVAPTSSTAITNLTDPTDKLIAALPAGYVDLGFLSTDGAQFGRDVESSDVQAWGPTEPVRSDIITDTTTLQVACLETRRETIGLFTNTDMASLTPDPTSGELQIAKPARQTPRFYRFLSIGVDLSDDGEIYVARFLPRGKVSDYEEQPMQAADDAPLTYGVTITSYLDSTLGYSEKHFFGGPGWFALLGAMGLSA